MGHLNQLWEKYKDKGVMLIAVTNEGRKLVDAFVAKNGAKYPIVVETGDSGDTYEIAGYPSQFVIGPDGKIAGNSFDEGLVDSLLPRQRIPPKLPEKATDAAKLLEKGKYADARKSLEAFAAGKVSAEDIASASAAMKWIDDAAAASLAAAADSEKVGDVSGAAQGYEDVAADFAGLEAATKAADALKALLADPAKKNEVDGAKALAKARGEARDMTPKKAIPVYKAIATKFKGTKAGEKAQKYMQALEEKLAKKGGK